jgi:hypothetical protein
VAVRQFGELLDATRDGSGAFLAVDELSQFPRSVTVPRFKGQGEHTYN